MLDSIWLMLITRATKFRCILTFREYHSAQMKMNSWQAMAGHTHSKSLHRQPTWRQLHVLSSLQRSMISYRQKLLRNTSCSKGKQEEKTQKGAHPSPQWNRVAVAWQGGCTSSISASRGKASSCKQSSGSKKKTKGLVDLQEGVHKLNWQCMACMPGRSDIHVSRT